MATILTLLHSEQPKLCSNTRKSYLKSLITWNYTNLFLILAGSRGRGNPCLIANKYGSRMENSAVHATVQEQPDLDQHFFHQQLLAKHKPYCPQKGQNSEEFWPF